MIICLLQIKVRYETTYFFHDKERYEYISKSENRLKGQAVLKHQKSYIKNYKLSDMNTRKYFQIGNTSYFRKVKAYPPSNMEPIAYWV